jgi:hypothetical protein
MQVMDENPKPVIEKSFALMACVECGAEAYASCNCNKVYRPKELAAKAIADNPGRSNRAIAQQFGLSEPTVRRARTASPDAVDRRIGLDGKTRRQPVPKIQVQVLDRHETPVVVSERVVSEPARPTINIELLRQAWREVEVQAAAGNRTRFMSALAGLATATSDALKEGAQ